MDRQQKSGNGQLIGGMVLILIGALFLALFLMDRFDMFDVGWVISRFWPSVLIFIGVTMILKEKRQSLTGPLVLIAIGAIFQADRLRLFDWRFSRLWPVIIIAIGVAMLTDRLRRLGASQPLPPAPPAGGTPQHNPQS
jgi:lia operon protein LiaF